VARRDAAGDYRGGSITRPECYSGGHSVGRS
jgi:hypothetical protein